MNTIKSYWELQKKSKITLNAKYGRPFKVKKMH